MAADSALSTLLNTLDDILARGRLIDLPTAQLTSLRDQADSLRDCLRNMPTYTTHHVDTQILEAKIREEVFRAESLIAARVYKFSTSDLFVYLGRFLGICVVLVFFRNLLISNVTIILCILWISFHPYLSRFTHNPVNALLASVRSFVLCINSMLSLLLQFLRIWSRSETGNLVLKILDEFNVLQAELVRIGKHAVVGTESDLKEMRGRLTFTRSGALEFIPIVGMCGIGKTTLASHVYEDSCIRSYFDVRAWTTVSQSCSFSRVLLQLLESTKLGICRENDDSKEENLGQHLYQNLYGRRYLIVMDDVWDVNILSAVKTFLPEARNGSRVLFTTRLFEVAGYAGPNSPAHELRFLNEDESTSLLENGVFGGQTCPDELRDIQDEIVEQCEGLPLALVLFSGLLSKIERTREDWRSLVDSLELPAIHDFDEKCMRILASSYKHLPRHLRPCFLYMGVFPEDYMVPVMKLAQLWAAEGFLRPNRFTNPEELAEEYLKDLVDRNLISGVSWCSQGNTKKYKMRDILRRLCLREARRKNFLFVINHEDNVRDPDIEIESSLRLTVQKIHPNVLNATELGNSKAHSLLCIRTNLGNFDANPQPNYLHYRRVRVLDLLTIHFTGFPLDVSNMPRLRYLALTFRGPFHPWISIRLQNLETLVMNNTDFDRDALLPVEIWMMPKLRHLYVRLIGLPIPQGRGDVSASLQTLVEVVNMSFGIHILERIKSLKKLGICYDVEGRSFRGWPRHELRNIAHLTQLKKLKLRVVNSSSLSMGVPYIPPDLAFPHSLRKLTLSGCRIPWERLETVGELPNIEVLKLRDNACQGEEWEPRERQFRQLKTLLLEHIDNLVHWQAEGGHFPRLQCLIIKSCDRLEGIPPEIGDIVALERIELFDCRQRVVNSAKTIQEDLIRYNEGNSDLKVNVYNSSL